MTPQPEKSTRAADSPKGCQLRGGGLLGQRAARAGLSLPAGWRCVRRGHPEYDPNFRRWAHRRLLTRGPRHMPPQLQGVIWGGGYRKGTEVVASQRAFTLPHPSLQPPSQLGTSCFPTKPPRAPGLPVGQEKGQPATSRPSGAEETHGSMGHTGPSGLKAWALRAGPPRRLSPRARHGTHSSQNP